MRKGFGVTDIKKRNFCLAGVYLQVDCISLLAIVCYCDDDGDDDDDVFQSPSYSPSAAPGSQSFS